MRRLVVALAASFAVALPLVQVRLAPAPALLRASSAPARSCPGNRAGAAHPSSWSAGMPPGPGAVAVARSLEPEWASLEHRVSAGAPDDAARARAELQAWRRRLAARRALPCAPGPDDAVPPAAPP